jgi:hypothetical protein
VARIDIRGHTGLSAEDYDQTVTITPRLTSSLPLAPICLAEKVLNAQIFVSNGMDFSSSLEWLVAPAILAHRRRSVG